MLVDNYFCTHVSRLLDFDTDDMVSFDIKYFFIGWSQDMHALDLVISYWYLKD